MEAVECLRNEGKPKWKWTVGSSKSFFVEDGIGRLLMTNGEIRQLKVCRSICGHYVLFKPCWAASPLEVAQVVIREVPTSQDSQDH